MDRGILAFLSLSFITLLISGAYSTARAATNPQNASRVAFVDDDWDPVDRGRDTFATDRQDTLFCFAASGEGSWGTDGTDERGFTFQDSEGNPVDAGWIVVDETAQTDAYWHLADAQLNEGHGTAAVLDISQYDGQENNYALWCGREDVCGWRDSLGYGDNWDQYCRIGVGAGPTSVTYSFQYVADFEGNGFDFWQLLAEKENGELDIIEENRVTGERTLLMYSGTIEGVRNQLILRFVSDRGFSDEDGWYNSDIGAVWIDVLEIDSGDVVFATDFENGAVPDSVTFTTPPGAGLYGGLYTNLHQEDPHFPNPSAVWAFFDWEGPTENPEYPIPVIVYGPPYMDNSIQSPLLEAAHSYGVGDPEPVTVDANTAVELFYMCYFDNPLNPLIFQTWMVAAQTEENPCLGRYYGDGIAWYSDAKQWRNRRHNATFQVLRSANWGTVSGLSVKLNVVDMCAQWCDVFGDGTGHTPAPYFDNVRLMLINASSASWIPKLSHRAQDGVREDDQTFVRIDSALDLECVDANTVTFGDSFVIGLNMDLMGGIDTIPVPELGGELRPDLRMYWRIIEGPHTDSTEVATGDPDGSDGIHSPHVGVVEHLEVEWNTMIADYAQRDGEIAADLYAFDLNDDYYEGGDVILYFYRAVAGNGTIEYFPPEAEHTGPLPEAFYSIRCLPTAGATMLFVEDDMGALSRWYEAFVYNGFSLYDVFTTQNPGGGQNNGLAGKADIEDLVQYNTIIWDSGDLPNFTISSNKDYDCASDANLLDLFLNDQDRDTYLWVMGNVVANELGTGSSFLATTLGVDLLDANEYYDDETGILVPKVFATHPFLEYLGGEPWIWVDGGIPTVEKFSRVAPLGGLAEESHAWEVQADAEVAGIFNMDPDGNGTVLSPTGFQNRTVFNPFSYFYCLDGGYGLPADHSYVHLMVQHVLTMMFSYMPDQAPNNVPDLPAFTRLDGCYPNPFNPGTTFRFSLASEEFVHLNIYDIAGRRVRCLLNGPLEPNFYELSWDGTNEDGARVASGVYLYRLIAGGYSVGGKLVMLK